MIESEAVVTTSNSFVVADKITKQQWVRGYNENTILLEVADGGDIGFLVETEHFFIVVSPDQRFIVSETEAKQARDLKDSDSVLTSDGFQELTNIKNLKTVYKMTNLRTKSRIFLANGFYLVSD